MSVFVGKARALTKRLGSTGFFHIFGASTVNKVIAALLSIVLVRVMTKHDFGAWSYAYNIASFFIIFNGLGASAALLQLGSELNGVGRSVDRLAGYAMRCGVVCDIGMTLLIIICSAVVPLAVEGSNRLLALYCLFPLFSFLYEMRLTYLRVQLRNKTYALLTNIQTVLNFSLSVGGALLFGAAGLIVGQQLALIAAWIWGVAQERKSPGTFGRGSSSECEERHRDSMALGVSRRTYWQIALMSALNNGLSQMLTLVGTFLVGFFLASDALVAEYKVATTVPFALLFLPSVICTYIYPHFARHKDDARWTKRAYLTTVGISAVGFFALTLGLSLFAEPLVLLLFGEAYSDIVPVFRVLLLGFFLAASFRQVSGNLLVTQRKLGMNFVIGVISIVTNVAISIIAIPTWGVMGAAWAWTLTMGLGGLLSTCCYLSNLHAMQMRAR